MKNLRQFFYKTYYSHFNPRYLYSDEREKNKIEKDNADKFEEKNQELFDFKVPKKTLERFRFKNFGAHLYQFSLQTIYPGLLIGTGYMHETGSKGELKIGFYFDYTTGLPVLPGHSVKGALRAYFPRLTAKLSSTEPKEMKCAKAAYILSLLGLDHEFAEKNEDDRLEWVTKLEMQIFDVGSFCEEYVFEENETLYMPDVFLDAQIGKAAAGDNILGPDTITPHKEVFKDPIPLPFVKVLPCVTWEFSFLLHDTEIDGIKISAQEKCKLFKNILLDQGIGAKTNVGYGQFEEPTF